MLPEWSGAKNFYDRAYNWLHEESLKYSNKPGDWPTDTARDLMDALDRGDEEELKSLWLYRVMEGL